MTVATGLKTKTKRTQRHKISAKWRKLFKLIPGYDPVATAAPGDRFDEAAADSVIEFFVNALTHVKGELAGQPFMLEPHERAITGCIFGWKRRDGTRRYREVFYFVPRKNDKSTLAAGIVNYVLFCDGEPGAELYSTAADRDQAALVYAIAKGMVLNNPNLNACAKIYHTTKSIEFRETNSIYRAISAEANTKHGYNTHLSVNDELHAHKNAELIEVIQTSTGARRQPLIIHITTSDFEREGSVCNDKYDYARKVRDGVIKDRAFLPIIYEASIDDDWTDPKVWAKANPMLGKSVPLEYLQRECQRAKESPAYENTFKRLHLNIRTEQDVRWMPLEKWDKACGLRDDETPVQWRGRMLEELKGRSCFIGMDLSAKVDLTSVVQIFPPKDEGESWKLIPWFWLPEDKAREVERKAGITYREWERHGFIQFTEGNEVDLQAVRNKLNELHGAYPVTEIGYDDWLALEIGRQLREVDGFEMTPVRQGSKSLSDPMKSLDAMIGSGRIEHGGNPILRWNASCVAAKEDENGNIQPNKKKSSGKIDGIVATITGMARALPGTEKKESVYETRGVICA